MIESKGIKPHPAPGHENEVRLAGLILTVALVMALLAAPMLG